MKRTLIAAAFSVLAVTGLAFTNDVLKKLDMAEEEAKEYIFGNFAEGDLSFPRTAALKKIAAGDRAGLVTEMGLYIKSYAESPEFREAYARIREGARPEGPADVQTLIKQRLEQIESDIEQNETDMKKASGDMKKLYELTVSSLKDERKALKDPKDPRHRDYVEQLTEDAGEEAGNAAERIKEFEKQYPATVKELVKGRLREFLALTATIDFSAKLVKQGNHMKFADPRFEAKDHQWKRCFRAGPETVKAARDFATKWLAELK